ncbi:MAG: ArsB/NhaD family transporter [Termitinemataceae bacterium]|nr:MAG: ArsB/NhaD family transporter [Termitinemataceae bacterium]
MSTTAWIALILFLCVYIFIAAEKINKIVISLLGGVIFIILGIISQEDAFMAIDWNVIFLLVSMMIIVNITKTTGIFQFLAIKTAKFAKGNPIVILILMSLITALISAFLDNVTTVVLLSPVTILIAVELGITPLPFIICQAIASNIGGTATLIGDPPNIMIGSKANLDFMDFVVNLSPVIILILIAFSVAVLLLFRKQLHVSDERKARIMHFDENKSLENKPLMIKCIIVLTLTVFGFLFHGKLGIEASSVALFSAALLMLLSGKHELDEYFRDIEWGTIFFFIGLFIMVQGLVDMGWITKCAGFLMTLTNNDMPLTAALLIWFSGILSAVVDNIPYVATMIPMVQDIAAGLGEEAALPLWWALSLGACLGGNATLIGSSAGVISANMCTKNGYTITFMDFTKYGALITFISLSFSTVYVLLRYYS